MTARETTRLMPLQPRDSLTRVVQVQWTSLVGRPSVGNATEAITAESEAGSTRAPRWMSIDSSQRRMRWRSPKAWATVTGRSVSAALLLTVSSPSARALRPQDRTPPQPSTSRGRSVLLATLTMTPSNVYTPTSRSRMRSCHESTWTGTCLATESASSGPPTRRCRFDVQLRDLSVGRWRSAALG